jgi:hypothetical protein
LEWQYTTEINDKIEFGLSHSENIHVLLTKIFTNEISDMTADSKKAEGYQRDKRPKGATGFFLRVL